MMPITNPAMLPKVRSERLRQEIKQMPCALRIASFAGLPCSGQDTVVGAHLPVFGKGMSTKVSDLYVVAACHACHDMLDSRRFTEIRHRYPTAITERMMLAMAETQGRWLLAGLIEIPGAELI